MNMEYKIYYRGRNDKEYQMEPSDSETLVQIRAMEAARISIDGKAEIMRHDILLCNVTYFGQFGDYYQFVFVPNMSDAKGYVISIPCAPKW